MVGSICLVTSGRYKSQNFHSWSLNTGYIAIQDLKIFGAGKCFWWIFQATHGDVTFLVFIFRCTFCSLNITLGGKRSWTFWKSTTKNAESEIGRFVYCRKSTAVGWIFDYDLFIFVQWQHDPIDFDLVEDLNLVHGLTWPFLIGFPIAREWFLEEIRMCSAKQLQFDIP